MTVNEEQEEAAFVNAVMRSVIEEFGYDPSLADQPGVVQVVPALDADGNQLVEDDCLVYDAQVVLPGLQEKIKALR